MLITCLVNQEEVWQPPLRLPFTLLQRVWLHVFRPLVSSTEALHKLKRYRFVFMLCLCTLLICLEAVNLGIWLLGQYSSVQWSWGYVEASWALIQSHMSWVRWWRKGQWCMTSQICLLGKNVTRWISGITSWDVRFNPCLSIIDAVLC